MCKEEGDECGNDCGEYKTVVNSVCLNHSKHKHATFKHWQPYTETALFAELRKKTVRYVYVQCKPKPDKKCEWSGLCKLRVLVHGHGAWTGNHLISVKDGRQQLFTVSILDCLAFGIE